MHAFFIIFFSLRFRGCTYYNYYNTTAAAAERRPIFSTSPPPFTLQPSRSGKTIMFIDGFQTDSDNIAAITIITTPPPPRAVYNILSSGPRRSSRQTESMHTRYCNIIIIMQSRIPACARSRYIYERKGRRETILYIYIYTCIHHTASFQLALFLKSFVLREVHGPRGISHDTAVYIPIHI